MAAKFSPGQALECFPCTTVTPDPRALDFDECPACVGACHDSHHDRSLGIHKRLTTP
jgi:hypothetical protein